MRARSQVRGLVLAMVAALAFAAVAASAAQATEGPFFKVSGARLGSGETKALKVSAKENLLITGGLSGIIVSCRVASASSGAKIVGSAGANSSTSEEVLVFSGCTVTGAGEGCTVENETITTSALKGTLGYATSTRTGRLTEVLKPASGKAFATIKFVENIGGECKLFALPVEGSIVANLSGGGSAVEVGVNETQGKVRELVFPSARVKEIWTESAGALTKVGAGLSVGGTAANISGKLNAELEAAPEWGFFTK